MTLIVSQRNSTTGLFTLSDTVLSTRLKEGEEPPVVWLPHNDKPISHVNGDYALSAVTQKSVIFKRTMILWAGWAVVAKGIIKLIEERSKGGEFEVNLHELCRSSGFSDSELNEVSLIYHYNVSRRKILRASWNCDETRDREIDLISGGTGSGFFFQNLSVNGIDHLPHREEILSSLMSKLAINSLYERDNRSTYDFMYGGWFELANKTQHSFEKVCYAIKFWPRWKGALLSGGPTVVGWYSGHNLILSRHSITEETIGEFNHHTDHSVVYDFLHRDNVINPPSAVIRPKFISHVVLDMDEGLAYVRNETDPNSQEMIVEVGPAGMRVAWTHGLRERLYAMRDHTVSSTITQNWFPT